MSRLNSLVYNNNPLKGANDASGIYRARVEDNKDPLGIGRVKIRIPKFHGLEKGGYSVEALPWATMISQSAGSGYGSFIVPEIGEYVMVQFEDEDLHKPVYYGSLYGTASRKAKPYESAGEKWKSAAGSNEVPYSAQREDPTKKILYRSPKGAEISVDEEKGYENIVLSDVVGQNIVMNSPTSPDSTHDEPISSGQANITITGLNGQMLDLNSTDEVTEINIICRECAVTLKPDEDGIAIYANNSCITLDKEGTISLSGGAVSIATNDTVNIQSQGTIDVFGEHVTIGNEVTIIEGWGGGQGSDYEGSDRDPNLVDISEVMKDVDTSDWDQVCAAMKKFMSENSGVYNQKGSVRFEWNGKVMNLRTDCSGYVSACLNVYGALNNDAKVSSANLCSMTSLPGFTKANFTDWSDLKKGDILVVNGHTEIYQGEQNGKHMVLNYGSNYSASNTGATPSGHDRYTYVYRPTGE